MQSVQFMAGYQDALTDIKAGGNLRYFPGNPETEYRNGYNAACEDYWERHPETRP